MTHILEPLYIQYFQDQYLTNNRHLSAFKPLSGHPAKDITKIRHTMRYAEPPILQHPERVVPHSKSESFEGNYQPNVALAPTAKKHRYLNQENNHVDDKEVVPSNEVSSSKEGLIPKATSVIRHDKYIEHSPKKSPDSQNIIDSTVSVVQSTGNLGRYNSEIELSTDTDDSGSETSEKPDICKMEEIMKDVDHIVRDKVLEMFRHICKEYQELQKENRSKNSEITELTNIVTDLKKQLLDLTTNQINPNISNGFAENSLQIIEKAKDRTPTPTIDNINIVTTSSDNQPSIIENIQPQTNNCGEDNSSSSNEIAAKESEDIELVQSTSVIASIDDQEKTIKNCTNTNGVTFPTDVEVRSKWIACLGIEKYPSETSIVCLDHFRNSDLDDSYCRNDNLTSELNIHHDSIQQINKHLEETDIESVCRLCATSELLTNSIYESIDNEPISSMIMQSCHPIVVDDGYPSMICSTCLQQLQAAYNFRKRCLDVNRLWYNRQELYKKRKQDDNHIQTSKRQCIQSVPEIGEDNIKDTTFNLTRHILNTENHSGTSEEQIQHVIFTTEPPPLLLIEKNIGSEKQVDDQNDKIETKMPISVETENKTFIVKKTTNKPNQQVIAYKDNKIVIPDGITVRTSKKFESSTGMYSCTITHGLQESVFVMADGYLFTFGLLKGNTSIHNFRFLSLSYISLFRHLRCVLPNCKAKAEQTLLESDTYEDKITVKVPHSHKPPNNQLRKKHMFFHVMRKRMQHDKTLNIRSIYEEVCNQEPEIRQLVPLRNVINEICKHQVSCKLPRITSFEKFYEKIEDECYEKLHFTNTSKQFYQERFCTDDGCMAIVFCNMEVIENITMCTLMYVDASFKIDTFEDFKYQLVTVLVWIDDSYYPILYALVNRKTQEIFKKVFQYLHDVLAPNIRPHEIVTDYEANLYYALGETYLESHIGGSVFYYTQNLYKKICSLNLSRELETNSNFRNLYHMLLMLPLLPVNTISDALNNIELQSKELELSDLAKPIFDHIYTQWISNVTTEMFCVHRLENRINENVIAPFKKLRDYLLLFKRKVDQTHITIGQVVEKLIELDSFLHEVYNKSDKKSFGRDLSSFQKKNVIRAWQFIETHPKININNFFQKVLGYIKCMENQLWIWGFYRYAGDSDDILINVANASVYLGDNGQHEDEDTSLQEHEENETEENAQEYMDSECQDTILSEEVTDNPTIVMEAVIDNDGGVMLQSSDVLNNSKLEKTFFKYIRYE
ncbi:hypothetical protein MML48_8g00009394 [Holotrichia oblita]|uniref:Uncharacterized protein n=1 Tax=Holotrichia oblita TaxID=644536 RepID=A0ACB9SU75_HOLOL|nr:hypothetical protein MML48_8g00009394 [Holotrichia oblita]